MNLFISGMRKRKEYVKEIYIIFLYSLVVQLIPLAGHTGLKKQIMIIL